jgi:hypothetical protein
MAMLIDSHNDLTDNEGESHNDNNIVEKVWPKQTWSIAQLEAAVKRRIGWVDEAISPFARRNQQERQTSQAKASAR